MSPTSPAIFISYSHDSLDHKELVRALSDRLCQEEGIDCRIDQYIQNPAEGWPRWCENIIEQSRFVLVVCTETYHRRFTGQEKAGKGKGVTFEGYVITQHLYDASSRNEKFIPILLRPEDESFIPTPLRGASRFLVTTAQGYEDLCRLLTDQPAVSQPPLGHLRHRPPRPPATAPFLTSGPRTLCNLPYLSIGTLFKGREEIMDQLQEGLRAGQAVGVVTTRAVHGLGGVGKTRLAVEYGWQRRDEYGAILFAAATSPEELQRNLAGLDRLLGLGTEETPEEEVRFQAVLHWLAGHPGWLLILDNVDNEEAARTVEEILPRLGRGHVLITSRLADWSAAVTTLELDVLAPEEAQAFLLERTASRRLKRSDDEALAASLAEALGNLALALEQAGAYIHHHRCSLADYLERWQEQDARVREWFDERLMNYPRSVATTWETSFAQLDTAARDLLYTLAWLAPEPMPAALFPREAEAGLVGLLAYSLARRDHEGKAMVTVHRLVQEVTRHRIPTKETSQWIKAALRQVNSATPGNPEDVRTWPAWDRLRPHAEAIIGYAERTGIPARRGPRHGAEGVRLGQRGTCRAVTLRGNS